MQDICLDRYGKITSYKSKHKKGNYIAAIPFVTRTYGSSNFLKDYYELIIFISIHENSNRRFEKIKTNQSNLRCSREAQLHNLLL